MGATEGRLIGGGSKVVGKGKQGRRQGEGIRKQNKSGMGCKRGRRYGWLH